MTFDECKNESKVMDDFRNKTIVSFIGKELRFFDPETTLERHVKLDWMSEQKYHYSCNWIDYKQ